MSSKAKQIIIYYSETKVWLSVVLLVFVLIPKCISSQNAKVDSIRQLLAKHTYDDTIKVDLINSLVYWGELPLEQSMKYCDTTKQLSEELKYKKGFIKSSYCRGVAYYENQMFDSSLISLKSARNYAISYHFKNLQADIDFYLSKLYSNSGDYKKALEYLLGAKEMQERLKINKDLGYTYGALGYLYDDLGQYSQALKWYKKAVQLKKEFGNKKGEAATLHNIGITYLNLGSFELALEYYLQSLAIEEELNNRSGMAYSYNVIGGMYYRNKEYSKSLEYYEKAYQMHHEGNNKKGEAFAFVGIGLVLEDMGKYTEALSYYKKALQIRNQYSFKSGIAFTYRCIGEIHFKLGHVDSALHYYNYALAVHETQKKPGDYIANNFGLARVFFTENNAKKACGYGEKGYVKAVEISDYGYQKQGAKLLSEIYARLGNYSQAYEMYNSYIALTDSANNASFIGKLKSQEFRQQYDKDKLVLDHKMKQQDIQIAKHKQQTQYLLLLVILSLVLVIFGLFSYLKFKRKNKALFNAHYSITKARLKQRKASKPSSVEENYEELEEVLKRLDILMKTEKIYTNNDLTLDILAEKLNRNRSFLSKLINEQFGCHFNRYLNQFRINEAKILLSDPEYQNYTIEGVANEVGFNSKSSFNAAFKELIGITPSFYKAEAMNELALK